MQITKEYITGVIGNAKTEKQIVKAIEKAGIHSDCYENTGAESGYINFHFWKSGGMIRVYKNQRGDICIQEWDLVKFSYSGIPTFFNGGEI